jgi:hypothetical protein
MENVVRSAAERAFEVTRCRSPVALAVLTDRLLFNSYSNARGVLNYDR